MRHLTTLFAVAIILTCRSAYGQDEPGPNYQHLKPMEWMIGEWINEAKLPNDVPGLGKAGDPITIPVTYEWQLKKNVIVIRIAWTIKDKVMPHRITTVGWDAEQKQLVTYGFDVRGQFMKGNLTFTDADTQKMTARTVSADGTVDEGTLTVKRIDGDTFTYTFGDEQNPIVMTFKRKK